MANEDDTISALVPALNQLSETSRRILRDINFSGINQIQNALRENAKAVEISQMVTFSSKVLESYLRIQDRLAEAFKQKYIYSDIFSGYEKVVDQMARTISSSFVIAEVFNASKMLNEIKHSIATVNINGCTGALQNAIDAIKIQMPDLVFIKTSDLVQELKFDLVLPTGFASDIKNFNKASARRLIANSKIIFDCNKRQFFDIENDSSSASVTEMNSICCFEIIAEDVESGEIFTENELMGFMTFLSEKPMLALRNIVGKKIFKVVKKFPLLIDFDEPKYYHSRARKKEVAPYIWQQMRTAPYGVTFPGRYNHVGQAHFYFANTQEGTINEIKKHMSKSDMKENVIQTAVIRPKQKIKMIDLSAKAMRGYNVFLKHIRFPLGDDTSKSPRVYLIPSFVSECCKECGIDGIKYYGGEFYSNYVTWNDSYFDFLEMRSYEHEYSGPS